MGISGLGSTATELSTNYLNLLITQLQNQNPLDPMDNSEMAGQLAQLAQLEQTEKLGTSFDQVLASTQVNQATSLIGKTISWLPSDSDTIVHGTVDGVSLLDSKVQLMVGNSLVEPASVLGISN